MAACTGTSVNLNLNVENGTGPNVWISQDVNTVYNAGIDLLVALDGSTTIAFPTDDLTLFAYDESNPNCAVRITYTSGDYICPGGVEGDACFVEEGIVLACRLDPEAVAGPYECNAQGTLDLSLIHI